MVVIKHLKTFILRSQRVNCDPEIFRRKQTDKAKHVAKEILVLRYAVLQLNDPLRVLPIESVLNCHLAYETTSGILELMSIVNPVLLLSQILGCYYIWVSWKSPTVAASPGNLHICLPTEAETLRAQQSVFEQISPSRRVSCGRKLKITDLENNL